MFTRGEFTIDNVTYGAIVNHTKTYTEAILINSGTVVSAYKIDSSGSYSYNNVRAKELVQTLQKGLKGCTSKNSTPMPFELGAMNQHEFIKTKIEYIMQLHRGELVGAYIQADDRRIELDYIKEFSMPNNIPYIKLTEIKKDLDVAEDDLDAVPVRSVQEIALEKDDITWLQNKKYYIVNDDETAEKLFTFLENYKGPIAYDTETTGLRINCFGKINSEYQKTLIKYNEENPKEQIRADKLVGIIFCVEKDVSYYFPCFNRKFKNLYEDLDSPVRTKTINNIKARYTIGELKDKQGDMADYVKNTPSEQFDLGVILMERVRDILEKGHIVAHNGTFEWKVGWQYEIDTNLKDDTMLLHQIMYKFRSTTSNRGEPSNLKYLAKRELGIDQWELGDFFPDWKADTTGTVRTKSGGKSKKGSKIDFSYMDYEGTRVYAPTDGDVTLQLFNLYKLDMIKNHKEMEYIYEVEVVVACAVAYMEFYGHRLDEKKIYGARTQTRANIAEIVSEIRQLVNYSNDAEIQAYKKLKELRANKQELNLSDEEFDSQLTALADTLEKAIADNTDNILNLASPAQVCDLFYNKLGIPFSGEKQSVAKKEVKALLKEKDDEGNPKYPVVHLYSKYKNEDTLMTKFFDNLPYFMYPGGYIFSGYGQISTATGRMSCIEEHTKIMTVGGEKEIKDVKVGDLVYCYDDNGNVKVRKVLNVIDNGIKDCIELTWKSKGNGTTGTLICTPDHKILSRDDEWVRADSLNIGDRVYHLHRSNEDRPRLFGANSFCEQEQLFIKKEVYGVDSYNVVIHHKDEDKTNNDLSNLELQSRPKHSSIHGIERAACGKVKYEHLLNCEHKILSGKEHPNYKDISREDLIQMLKDNNGVVSNLPIDYTTFVKKCKEYDIDCTKISNEIKGVKIVSDTDIVEAFKNTTGNVYAVAKYLGIGRIQAENRMIELGLLDKKVKVSNVGISDEEFIDKFMEAKGSIRGTARLCNITFWKAKNKIIELGLSYNHSIIGSRPCGKKHVYDLEVEEFHNFISNEICVHNCSKPNAQQYPKVITKIVSPRPGYVMVDADYSQIEYRVLTAMAGNEWLAELFSDPDSDYHTLMASLMYDVDYSAVTPSMRSAAKSFNFGIPYGMGFGSLAILLTGKNTAQTRDEAKEKYEDYFKNQPKTRMFFDNVKEMAQVNKYTKTLFNRYRYYSFEDKDGNVNQGKKAAALRQAGNAVIQGTAADIFKIGVARNFSFIRKYKLFGDFLIVNMVHDEQLMEINAQKLNVQRILAEVGENMQFKLEGFPPLYIGAGVGSAWGYAKGKAAEIHPVLLEQLTQEAKNIPIFREDTSTPVDAKSIVDYFDNRVVEFRRQKVYDYLSNTDNWHKVIHPAIAGLVNLQFNYGRGDDAKAYTGPNGETYTDAEFLSLNIADFLKENNIDAEASWFSATELKADVEEEKEYTDEEVDDEFSAMVEAEEEAKVFTLIDESDKLFGSSIHDMISVFGTCILTEQKICGVDTRNMYFKKKDAIIDYLIKYMCDENDPDGLQIVFLTDANILKYTGIYVKNLDSDKFNYLIKNAINKESDYTQGDVKTRSQAK